MGKLIRVLITRKRFLNRMGLIYISLVKFSWKRLYAQKTMIIFHQKGWYRNNREIWWLSGQETSSSCCFFTRKVNFWPEIINTGRFNNQFWCFSGQQSTNSPYFSNMSQVLDILVSNWSTLFWVNRFTLSMYDSYWKTQTFFVK